MMRKSSAKTPRFVTSVAIAASMLVAMPAMVFADSNNGHFNDFTLFGHARVVTWGIGTNSVAADLTSNCGAQPYSITCYTGPGASAFVYSGIAYKPDHGHLPTLSQIKSLSTDFNMNGTDCSGGSPRIVISTNNHTFVMNIGQAPFGGNCYYGWQNTGNLVSTADSTSRWQVDLANTFSTWAEILALHGSEIVNEVDIVLDGGWVAPRGQDVTIDNFTVNNDVSDFD